MRFSRLSTRGRFNAIEIAISFRVAADIAAPCYHCGAQGPGQTAPCGHKSAACSAVWVHAPFATACAADEAAKDAYQEEEVKDAPRMDNGEQEQGRTRAFGSFLIPVRPALPAQASTLNLSCFTKNSRKINNLTVFRQPSIYLNKKLMERHPR